MTKPYLDYYCHWAKLRIISKVEIPDREPRFVVYRYKVQKQKRFLWWNYWRTVLSCNKRNLAKEVYYELMNQAREKQNAK